MEKSLAHTDKVKSVLFNHMGLPTSATAIQFFVVGYSFQILTISNYSLIFCSGPVAFKLSTFRELFAQWLTCQRHLQHNLCAERGQTCSSLHRTVWSLLPHMSSAFNTPKQLLSLGIAKAWLVVKHKGFWGTFSHY